MHYKPFSHEYWLDEALQYVQKDTIEIQRPEVPICALIVKNNQLISIALNKVEKSCDATAHAEMLVIKEASEKLSNWRLNDYILYSTLEPCSMCMGAILNSRIEKVIFGAYDLKLGACGSALHLAKELNKQNQVEIIGGILEIECEEIIKDFFSIIRNSPRLLPGDLLACTMDRD